MISTARLIPAIVTLVVSFVNLCALAPNPGSDPQGEPFTIVGTTAGFADSTWFFLENANTGKTIDSAMLIGGHFQISGLLQENPMRAFLRTRDLSDYAFLWLGGGSTTFFGEKARFRHSRIAGSKPQEDENRINAIIMPMRDRRDSLVLLQEHSHSADSTALTKEVLELGKKETAATMDFVGKNPASIVSAYTLNVYKSIWPREEVERMFDRFSADVKNSTYGKHTFRYLSLNRNPKIGDMYTDFAERDTAGNLVNLSDISGRVVLLDFWASWCRPCREENPVLVQTYYDFKDKGFDVFGVSLDEDVLGWIKAIRDDKLPWRNVFAPNDFENDAVLIYGVQGLPDNFLIGKDGRILARNLRGTKLREQLAQILK
jgi:peroxiredoxin